MAFSAPSPPEKKKRWAKGIRPKEEEEEEEEEWDKRRRVVGCTFSFKKPFWSPVKIRSRKEGGFSAISKGTEKKEEE